MSAELDKFNDSARADPQDEAAVLEKAYLKHKRSLLAIAMNITQCQALAEDALQAAFSKLVKTGIGIGSSVQSASKLIDSGRNNSGRVNSVIQKPVTSDKLEAYIFQSVRNAALDIYRQRKRETEKMDSLFRARPAAAADPERENDQRQVNELIREEAIQTMQFAIDALPADDRELIVLKNFAGFTFEEISEITGINANTVATRYRRLIQKLRDQLKEHA